MLSTAPLPEPSEDTSRTDTVADVIYASDLPTVTRALASLEPISV